MKTHNAFVCLRLLVFACMGEPSVAQLHAEFTSNVQTGCPPVIVTFHDLTTGDPTNWKWTLGNGTTSILQEPATTYFDPGVYTVKLVVSNSGGADSMTKFSYIIVDANPTVDFSASPIQGCYPLDVHFTDSSQAGSGTISEHLWDFGDGNISNEQTPSHIYMSAGTFDISLKLTNSAGCSNAITKSDLIHIPNVVNAAFELSALDICTIPATAIFNNTSSGYGTLAYDWDFGDQTTSTVASPAHSYANGGSYKVLLTAQSSAGCTDTASSQLIIGFPLSSFVSTEATCSYDIDFTNTSIPLPVSSTWYFGDGTTSTEPNPDKTYARPGNYIVKLVNTFSSMCSDSVSKAVTIAGGPFVSFFAHDTSRCAPPLTVKFTNTTNGNASQYLWDFGDSTTSHDVNPTHTYTQDGTFTVALTANINGCENVSEKADYIQIHPQIISLANLPDSGCVPLTIHPQLERYTNTPIKKYTWDFGDGTISSAAIPVHTYTSEGFYNVKVTIETVDGCMETYAMDSGVLAGHKPDADFVSSFDSVCANETAVFRNGSGNGPITFLQWNYGAIVDAASGQYYNEVAVDTGYTNMTLVAFNYGCSDTITKRKVFYVFPPIARMNIYTHCDNKQSVDFIDNSIADISREWDFGDGEMDTARHSNHSYATGSYTVNLYTVNSLCKDTATSIVQVINESGMINLGSDTYCRGNSMTAQLTGINISNVKKTTWDFGDGTITDVDGEIKADHIYLNAGKFLIKATLTDLNNCEYLYHDSVTILSPLANFTSAHPGGCAGQAFSFTDSSVTDDVHGLVEWIWDFGDSVNGVYNSNANFQHTYTDTGYYTVQLKVTDSYGCSDSLSKINFVYVSHPSASFSVEDSITCPERQIAFENTSTGRDLSSLWRFGDGSEANETNPVHVYHIAGVYSPELTITDVNDCRDSFRIGSINVWTPDAAFTMSDSFATCPPLQVNFVNTSADYSSFTWDFGDGSSSDLISPSHIYTYAGKYPVRLIVSGYGTCADTVNKNVTINGPRGEFTYDSIPVCYPEITQFQTNAVNTSSYTWDFSDGTITTTSTKKTSHQYIPGYYAPKLILSDSSGCKVLIKGNDTVKVYQINMDALVLNTPACDSVPVHFIDQSTSGDSIIHHLWFFGDNDSEDATSVDHVYNAPGNYVTKLITTTFAGCKDSVDIPVRVFSKPDVLILSDPVKCSSASVNFDAVNNIADTSPISWRWDFGNDSFSYLQSDSTTYEDAGQYTVTATAINAEGCVDTASERIIVNPAPPVYAGPDTAICPNETCELTASGAEDYFWSGNGLSCTYCRSTNITTDTSSLYFVTGKSTFGCVASDTINVRVITPTIVSASGGDTICVGESTQFFASGAESYRWEPPIFLDNSMSSTPVFKPLKDTSINFRVIGYTEKKCFSDTAYLFARAYPLPWVDIYDQELVLEAGSSVRLNTNSSWDVLQWQWQPETGLDNPRTSNPMASPKQTTKYICLASNAGMCVARDEIIISVVCKSTNVFVPNTFSPNHDGVNDIFFPRGRGLFRIKSMRIFNRWGQAVFERFGISANNATDGWDGTYNGQALNSDVYVYVIEIVCENNATIPVKGNVTLLR